MATSGQFVRERIPVPISVPETARLTMEIIAGAHGSRAENQGPMTFRIVRRYHPTWTFILFFLILPLFYRRTEVCRMAVVEADRGSEILLEGTIDPALNESLAHLGRTPEAARVSTYDAKPRPTRVIAEENASPPEQPAAHDTDAAAPSREAKPASASQEPESAATEPAMAQPELKPIAAQSVRGVPVPAAGTAVPAQPTPAAAPAVAAEPAMPIPTPEPVAPTSPSPDAPPTDGSQPSYARQEPAVSGAAGPQSAAQVSIFEDRVDHPVHQHAAPAGPAEPHVPPSAAAPAQPHVAPAAATPAAAWQQEQEDEDWSLAPKPGAGVPSSSSASLESLDTTRRQVSVDSGESAELTGTLVLGRAPVRQGNPDAQLLTIDDPALSVSKTHASIEVHPSGVYITDLQSTNGTWLDDGSGSLERIPAGKRTYVPNGHRVLVGERILTFE